MNALKIKNQNKKIIINFQLLIFLCKTYFIILKTYLLGTQLLNY